MTRKAMPSTRCSEVRQRLADFAADRLGPTATGEVQVHLLTCDDCSEALTQLLAEEVAGSAVPPLTPPFIPPPEWYDSYMRNGSSRFGTFWKSVRNGLQAVDERVRDWAREARGEVAGVLEALAGSNTRLSPVATRGGGRVRSAEATRTGIQPSSSGIPATLFAEVVREEEETGETVSFAIFEPPRIAGRHFRVHLTTVDRAHDNATLICTVGRGGGAVSFSGAITVGADASLREVRINEPDVPGPAGLIPLEYVTLSLVSNGPESDR